MLSKILEKIYYASPGSIILCVIVVTGIYITGYILIEKQQNTPIKRYRSICVNTGIIVYIVIVLLITLLSRDVQVEKEVSLDPFSYLDLPDKIRGSLMNVLLFYPFGILAGTKWNSSRIILLGTFFSLVIEISQYCWKLGYAEINDVINNTLGMAVGVSVVLVFKKIIYIKMQNKKV